jgi:hypothetical protein
LEAIVMGTRETTIEDEVAFGLEEIDPSRRVEVPLRDLLFAYKLIGELYMFFRRPVNYPDLEALRKFIGDDGRGAQRLLREAYYQRLWRLWPEDITEALNDGSLQCPSHPPYYRP